ncbi:MAG TPA: DUF2569 family protein [Patescibacteria group bacterium]|nr:DUF2569 family protein [Patescibacteria group bacterium]
MPEEKKLEGLGGWLILVIIGFVLSTIMSLEFLLYPYGQSVITFLQQQYGIPEFITGILYCLTILFYVYSLFLMYKKKKSFVNWAIFTLWYTFVINAVIILMISGNATNLIFASASAILWTIYFKQSKRVKNTFIKH